MPPPTRLILQITRPPAPRAVALKFTPPPHDLPQSRALHAAIAARFGPLDAFRNLRHDLHRPRPGVVLALFRTPDAAQRILSASPLRAVLTLSGEHVSECELHGGEDATPDSAERHRRALEAVPRPELARAAGPAADDDWGDGIAGLVAGLDRGGQGQGRYSRPPTTAQKREFSSTSAQRGRWPPRQAGRRTLEFVVHAEPSRVDLEAGVAKHPCHGPFEVHVRTQVAGSVAARAPCRGLADLTLRRERKGWKDINRARKRAGMGGKTLREIWEEGQK